MKTLKILDFRFYCVLPYFTGFYETTLFFVSQATVVIVLFDRFHYYLIIPVHLEVFNWK